jgi:uncharacterized membrane protein YphA (DoxX/SURF4 family)
MTDITKPIQMSSWRFKGIVVLRIIFGLVWSVDAWCKWQSDFINNFSDYLTGTLEGQPRAVQSWINFWINIVKVDSHVFAHSVAISETTLAIGLNLGAFSNITNLGGILLAIDIWSTAEGFGRPYVPGSADIGSAIINALVFAGLFLANAGLSIGIVQWLSPKLGRWGLLASGAM